MNEQLLNFALAVATAAVPLVAGYATLALNKIAKRNGVELDQRRLERLNQLLVNGMNLAASEARQVRSLPSGASVKSFLIDQAIKYAGEHGKETLDAIGANLADPKVQEALRARAATLIADPAVPTPPLAEDQPKK